MNENSRYAVTIGESWYVRESWSRAHPTEPFVGLRVTATGEVWVACEPKVAGLSVPRAVFKDLEALFDQPGREAWVDDDVILFRAISLREAHRLAGMAVAIFQRHGLPGPPGT